MQGPWLAELGSAPAVEASAITTAPHSHKEQFKHEILYNHRLGHDMSLFRIQETSTWESGAKK